MTRAEELAHELETAIEAIDTELQEIPSERWISAVSGPEGWPVGHVAHHIGEGYLQSLDWISRALSDGKPVELVPEVDIPKINEANARCLEEHSDAPRAQTMTFMRSSARRLVEQVRALTDEQLDNPMMIVMGEPRPGSQVALPMALRHANTHMQSIRGATLSG
ncbi:MAG TPA: maleylpyruvate isomerase N-terminal domain-containing protein [Chloroflexota bacterium]